jgi:hypothetical protein
MLSVENIQLTTKVSTWNISLQNKNTNKIPTEINSYNKQKFKVRVSKNKVRIIINFNVKRTQNDNLFHLKGLLIVVKGFFKDFLRVFKGF